jgi:prolyl 4-hydroxylase
MDILHVALIRKLSRAAWINPENGELLSILRYQTSQEYKPHHDYLEEDTHDYSKVKASGQRVATLLTYLNEGYEGGETAFPKRNIAYKGQTGDALYFKNVDHKGHPADTSLHAGRPIVSGEKWLATLWCREKPFWPWTRGGGL